MKPLQLTPLPQAKLETEQSQSQSPARSLSHSHSPSARPGLSPLSALTAGERFRYEPLRSLTFRTLAWLITREVWRAVVLG